MNYPQANIFFQTILSNSPHRRSTVKNVIILFSLLFYTASSCVHTLNITLGCVLEVYRVKSVTNAKEGRGLVTGMFLRQATLTLLEPLFIPKLL